LDPAADKTLMTTLVITLAWAGLLPGPLPLHYLSLAELTIVPLAALILGRDVALSLSAFYFRFISLPPPVSATTINYLTRSDGQRTLSRYFNPSIPSAEVKPTQISKVSLHFRSQVVTLTVPINTALQLVLMGVTTVSPLVTYPIGGPLEALQWIVAGTTIWSGLSYVGKAGVRILPRRSKTP
jgi:cardiolipin synthase